MHGQKNIKLWQRVVNVQLMVRYGEFIIHQQSNYQMEMGSECSADGDIWGIYCLASEKL